MNISNAYARNKILFIVVGVSVGLHLLALVIFGTLKIVENITREEKTFEAPEIVEVPQEEPQYVVNLEQRNQSSAPPRPNPIVVDSPDVTIPALNIDVNIANSSSYGRGTGGFGTGVSDMREMALNIDSLEFFGKKMKSDAQRILFIIDMSGSMVFKERGIDGYQKVVNEIIKTLEPMEGVGTFNIMAFAGDVDKFRGSSFKPVTEDTIKRAEKWLNDRDPANVSNRKPISSGSVFENYKNGRHYGTRADLALEEGFKSRPNMIIFLSDGDPTVKTEAEVLKLVDDWQEDPKIPINTLSYRSKEGREFLKKLAANSGGTYTEVK
jgi:hypothetical protein